MIPPVPFKFQVKLLPCVILREILLAIGGLWYPPLEELELEELLELEEELELDELLELDEEELLELDEEELLELELDELLEPDDEEELLELDEDELEVQPDVQPDEVVPEEPELEDPPHRPAEKIIIITNVMFANRFIAFSLSHLTS